MNNGADRPIERARLPEGTVAPDPAPATRGRQLTIRLDPAPTAGTLAAWDELVTSTPGTDVTQLSVWARVRGMEGYRACYLLAWRGSTLVGGAQVLLRRLPGIGRLGYSSYGPLVIPAPGREAVIDRLAAALTALPGMRLIFLQPAEGDDDVRGALLRHGFRPSSAGIAPTGSIRLDLQRDEAAIRQGLPPRMQSWIRRWPAEGVRVRLG